MAVTISPGMVIDTGTWEALARQHGDFIPNGPAPQNVSPKPSDEGYAPRDKQQPVYRYFLTDGSTVDARTSADGTGMEIVAYKPSPSFTQSQRQETGAAPQRPPAGSVPRIEGTPTGQMDANGQPIYDNSQPIKAWHAPDGRVIYESLDANERADWERRKNGGKTDKELADASARSQPSTKQEAVPGYPGWTQATQADANGNQITVYYGPDDPQGTRPQRSLPAKPDPQQNQPQPVSAPPTQEYIVDRLPDGTIRTAKNPNYRGPEQKPGSQSIVTGGDGKKYVVSVDANGNVTSKDTGVPAEPQTPKERPRIQDPETKQWLEKGDDGVWRPLRIEGTGQTGNQGPSLPHIVLGQSTDALRQYREDLTRQVSAGTLPPAVAERRWAEATDLAGYAIREAQVVNQEEQSRRSADVSLRTNAMSNATSGFNSALSFIQHINDRLPVGSSAGGRAFAAILGMQQIHASRMGAFRNEFSDPSVPRTRGGMGESAPSSVTRPPVSASESAPPAPADGRSPVATPNGGSSTGNYVNPALLNPAPPNAIGAGAVPESITPAPATPPSVTAPYGGELFDPGTAGPPPTAAPVSSAPPPPLTSAMQAPGNGPLLRVRDPYGNDLQVTQQQLDNRPGGSKDLTVIGPVGMAPPPEQDFAALGRYMQPAPDMQPSPIAVPEAAPAPVGADMDPVAMRRWQIANTVPWRLSESDLAFAQQNGLMSEAMMVPGRRVA